VAAGLIGTWVVLRGLSFYSHAIGTAAFPGLVLADGLGFPAALGAFGMAAVFTGLSSLIGRSARTATDSATALVLVACLAAGVILASDVFNSGANIDTLLFGSLLAIGTNDLLLAGAAALVGGRNLLRDGASIDGRVGWRVVTRDRLPMAGRAPDLLAPMSARRDAPRLVPRREGLYLLCALGSRGITSAGLAARLVAAQACAAPWPVEADLADALDPARFALR